MSVMLKRNRQMVLAEFEQLLNLVFSTAVPSRRVNWREDPFYSAIRSFVRDSSAIVPASELMVHSRDVWLAKKSDCLDRHALRAFEGLFAEVHGGLV